MNWSEELKHWSANDDLGISRYQAFQLPNQVHPGSFTAHKSNMSAFVGPPAIMTLGKALP
jgi:hypothetical protein